MTDTIIPVTSTASGIGKEVAPDLYSLTVQIVNVCFVGHPQQADEWVLVDTGMPGSAERIVAVAAERFGTDKRPGAIILTHGHFDHVGAVRELAEQWDVPVYAHEQELPYLTGRSDYPQPDGSVEGGLVAKLSPLFPNEGIDLGERIHKLSADGTVPKLPGWRWIHTPGHTPGHVSLFREEDRALIAGDAFVTVRQDSLYKVIAQVEEINGPPRYLTTDWQAAWESVKQLAALQPALAVTGHGLPMSGTQLSRGLEQLAREFDRVAVPDYGRFVKEERSETNEAEWIL
ncbi:MBL fold metallo-hydrolase [Brevibacillus humidisoli]|uniref:MBL fold metallo-hydrolase n=1 Tax=Brevibacillus humidisoli TaxID=2895522 RepID=UPI001E32D52B|nr:MBL fold metallo-hydrolase [Brevibacillus humidisoli]UFJ40271.1 MBL fold metallo-hydrolase [Brevibacillus humidisoli]